MTCEDFIPFIDAYVDGEFDERERAEMEVHLGLCEECRERVEFQLELKQQFRDSLSQERAPDGLRERIFQDLESRQPGTDDELEEVREQSEPPTRPWVWRHGWVAAPLAAAIAIVIALPALTVAPAGSEDLPIVEQSVDWHQGNYPIEVTGPDSEEVSRWFRNKVDFPVRLPRFSRDNQVNLLGGRIAHVQDRRAAYLLYEVDGRRMSVLVFDGEGVTVPGDKIRKIGDRDVLLVNNKGYEVAVLQDSGVTYALTSELPRAQFVQLVSESTH